MTVDYQRCLSDSVILAVNSRYFGIIFSLTFLVFPGYNVGMSNNDDMYET